MLKMNLKFVTLLLYCFYGDFSESFETSFTLPGVIPSKDDTYICASFSIKSPEKVSFIKSYASNTNSNIVHHMLLFGCKKPFSTEPYYNCDKICDDDNDEKILFAWANNAEKFSFPEDYGMPIGGNTGITYVTLQVHYLKKRTMKHSAGMILEITFKPPTHLINIIRLSINNGSIPPYTEYANLDISCKYEGTIKASIYAFRVHAHTICRSVSGFKVSKSGDQIDLIGKANPQWPQAFYRPNSNLMIMPGDILMSRCVYDSTQRNHTTIIGKTHHDEMCMFYIMVASKNIEGNLGFNSCGNNSYINLWSKVPSYSMRYSNKEPSTDLFLSSSHIKSLTLKDEWNVQYILGEVSGLAINPKTEDHQNYSLLVLHRDDRMWNENTFLKNNYVGIKTEIKSKTILEIDPQTGSVLRRGGENLFILPHGITVTKDGKYVWITDVALHQVMRFHLQKDQKLMNNSPDVILGERFVPGNDKNHFCKPTKVAVDSKGFIFIADGYCNKRVIQFDPKGNYINELSTNDPMTIVHSITIEEHVYGDTTKNVVWTSDRENKRIIGFRYDGSIVYTSTSHHFELPIFAIEFNPFNRLLYGVTSNGEDIGTSFYLDVITNVLTPSWNTNYEMKAPHDICLAENGDVIFVAELHLKRVVKFFT